ncbi:MAG: hypothetical protein QM796_07385 [Chthoniobacteraceae bacterium]
MPTANCSLMIFYLCTGKVVESGRMKVKDLEFKKFIPADKIEKKVAALAKQIDKDYHDRHTYFSFDTEWLIYVCF